MATLAPALASASAISRPMGRAPPVTSADLPCKGKAVIAWSARECERLLLLWRSLFARLFRRLLSFASRAVSGFSRLVVAVNGVLLPGPLHTNLHRDFRLVDFEVSTVGLKALGDDLQADRIADRNHVDDGFAVLVGLQLHDALVVVALDGMEDDGSMLDRFAVGVSNDRNL